MEPADDEDLEARRRRFELGSAEAGALIGAAAGALIPGLEGALVGAGTGAMVQFVLREAFAQKLGQATEAFDVAADEAGLTPRELLERILADKELLHLASRVFNAAAETTLQAKIHTVGMALGRSVRDDALINEERFIVDSLTGLDTPHLLVLEQVYEDYEGYGTPRAEDGTPRAYGWTRHALAERLPGLAPVLTALLGILSSRGLIENTAVGTLGFRPGVNDRWILTEYGQDVVRWFERGGAHDETAADPSPRDPSEG